MRLLFEIDKKDYDPNGPVFIRHSARCIHIENGLVAMVYSRKYNYYKFPGGGIEETESKVSAMIREAREEAGLMVIPESVRAYGYVHRIQKSDHGDAECFIQDNFYYLCDIEERVQPQNLDTYEAEEGFVLEYVTPEQAIYVNRNADHGPSDQTMLEREARVLEILRLEGYFG